MWATLAIATALSLAPNADKLKITNARATTGILGNERKSDKYLPGDIYFLAFDIEGLTVSEEGKIGYSIGLELKDSTGAAVYKQRPQNMEAVNSLGGTSLPAFAKVEIGLKTPAGLTTLTIEVTDLKSKQSVTLVRKFTVLKKGFGIVRLGLSYDYDLTLPAPPLFVPGQQLIVTFFVAGFERDKEKNPNLVLKMTVKDDKGQATLKKPPVGEVKSAPANNLMLPLQFRLDLNRPGKYKIVLEAEDKNGKKKATESVEITVVEQTTGKKGD
jgi:hypothetical protein